MALTKYCSKSGCGAKTDYVNGVAPKTCSRCKEPFEAAFIKPLPPTRAQASNDYNEDDDWEKQVSTPTIRYNRKSFKHLAQVSVAKKVTGKDLVEGDVNFSRGAEGFDLGGGAVESNFNKAALLQQAIQATQNASRS